MVFNIAPAYYASITDVRARFVLSGSGFEDLPSDAVGLVSTSNNDPLREINSTLTSVILPLDVLSNTSLIAEHAEIHSIRVPFYVGAIVSADRQTIYWVNDTKPLP